MAAAAIVLVQGVDVVRWNGEYVPSGFVLRAAKLCFNASSITASNGSQARKSAACPAGRGWLNTSCQKPTISSLQTGLFVHPELDRVNLERPETAQCCLV